jgi:hypothetical protein
MDLKKRHATNGMGKRGGKRRGYIARGGTQSKIHVSKERKNQILNRFSDLSVLA